MMTLVNKSNAVTFYSQIFIVVIVVLACLINLTLKIEPQTLWITLLTSCVGYILPNPRLGSKNVCVTNGNGVGGGGGGGSGSTRNSETSNR